MFDILFVIFIIVFAGIAFNLQTSRDVKRRRAEARRDTLRNAYDEAEKRTIDLIGEDAFREMSVRIDEILSRHASQQGITLDLTCGPDTAEGSAKLHTLLPGNPLQIMMCVEGGVEWFDIYSQGSRIGRLALLEAAALKEIMQKNTLKAAYVAEQNCYGIEDSHMLSVIIFYEPKEDSKGKSVSALIQKGTDGTTNPSSIDICQN